MLVYLIHKLTCMQFSRYNHWLISLSLTAYMKYKPFSRENSLNGQANKGAGRMPWHWEPMKDVISCDKLRGAANKH